MFRSFIRNLLFGPFAVQIRRFVLVGAFTAGVQQVCLWLLVEFQGLNYLVAAVIAIEFTIILSYVLNNAWTFQRRKNTGIVTYLAGLVKTNVVRGTAIPIQLGILAGLVEYIGIGYLISNAVAIFISGLYRFVLDRQWTWN
jgi:putative flippase GtrA